MTGGAIAPPPSPPGSYASVSVLRIADLMLVKVVRNTAWLTIFTKRIVPTADVCAIGSQLGCLVRLNCEFIYSIE